MKASMFYRIAAVLLLLFEAGHTSGFPWSDPKWGVDLASMRSTHFYIMGFSRTYWDFYVGFGLFVSVFLLLAVVLAWQLGGLPPESLALMRGTVWTFALCFAAITVLAWKYFFYSSYHFLARGYIVFDRGRMAFSQAGFQASVAIVR
jgi:hypothetical protein